MGRASRAKKQIRRERDRLAARGPRLHVSLVTGISDGLDLSADIEHCKAALLYADEVTLYSPKVFFLASLIHLSTLTTEGALDLIAETAESLVGPDKAMNLQEVRQRMSQLPGRSDLTKEERVQKASMLAEMDAYVDDIRGVGEQQLIEAGAEELQPAIDAGLLTLDPLIRDEDGDDADLTQRLVDRLMDRLDDLMTSRSTYPFFDDNISDLVRAAISEGLLAPSPYASARGKSAGVGLGLVGRLPQFPLADMSEVIDIRQVLVRPLARFRAGVVAVSSEIQTEAISEDFDAHVDDLWHAQVRPALDEIEQTIQDDVSLSSLAGRVFRDSAGLAGGAATGTLLGMALGQESLVRGGLAVGLSGVTSTARAVNEQRHIKRGVERNQFYFLHAANKRFT